MLNSRLNHLQLIVDTVKWIFNISLYVVFIAGFLILLGKPCFSQSTKELDKKKQDNITKLNYSRELLEKTSLSKKSTLNQLNLIQENISLSEEIIQDMSSELEFLKSDIQENTTEIKRIENRIVAIKNDYANLIVSASRNLDNDFAMMYLLSSEDFNQAYQRIKYLKYLAEYRQDLVDNLVEEEELLKQKNLSLIDNTRKVTLLLSDRKRELSSLDKDKKKNMSLIKNLQSKESELKKDIQKREKMQAEIEKQIRKFIEEEAQKARAGKKATSLTVEEKLISSEFSKNLGRLPWPAERGVVTDKYGEHTHPVLKGVKINSAGIDITTSEGAIIRSVFDGEVTKVVAILGANYTVIIKHGEFLTVYHNLINVKVKVGDKVKTKQTIGTVFTDQENVSKFHFQIWKDKITQNPENWLSK